MDNYIKRFHDTERWADVEMPEIFSNKFKLEISNYGIVKRTEKETQEIVILKPGEWMKNSSLPIDTQENKTYEENNDTRAVADITLLPKGKECASRPAQ